jgi:hypothetical protein
MKKLKRWQKILLLLLVVLLVLGIFLPRPHLVDGSYAALLCAEEDSAPGEAQGQVTVQLHGFYLSSFLFQDRFYGTVKVQDYPRAGKNSGGKFSPMKLSKINSSSQMGFLFYYDSDSLGLLGYENLGIIFWDISGDRFVIQTNETDSRHAEYIGYPADTAEELSKLYASLSQP